MRAHAHSDHMTAMIMGKSLAKGGVTYCFYTVPKEGKYKLHQLMATMQL
jgi:hypothetical protein